MEHCCTGEQENWRIGLVRNLLYQPVCPRVPDFLRKFVLKNSKTPFLDPWQTALQSLLWSKRSYHGRWASFCESTLNLWNLEPFIDWTQSWPVLKLSHDPIIILSFLHKLHRGGQYLGDRLLRVQKEATRAYSLRDIVANPWQLRLFLWEEWDRHVER